ncbi:hypothetical protein GYMLUDRAFT_45130 [Collybiopsis luxurians FD-317 M1]|uniref:Major facilitator superfamily (MFS) profile domain-containing protein n=1 Tax=Collybiopsis luxurians FD-317 M1 TaxID=944289 RepID=A0A0D0BTQ9_9AGAR|nr:hypothetical protein GYMLUDRAFT_45130 [Collybiopsis luxurians FD-317 M1]
MGVSASIVSVSLSVSAFAASFASHYVASYLANYGQKPTYFVGQLLVVAGSSGLTSSRTVLQLTFWRFIQTVGGSPTLSAGQDAVGDIGKLDETARSLSLAVSHLGPTLAPVFGGVISSFASWQWNQIFLSLWGVVAFILTTLLSKVSKDVNRDRDADPSLSKPAPAPQLEMTTAVESEENESSKLFTALKLLKRPYILTVILAEVFVVLTNQVMLTPLSVTVGSQYSGLAGQIILGSSFILTGLGNCVSAPIASYISNRVLEYRNSRRRGVHCPEDRLVGAVFACATLVPLSVLGLGIATAYLDGILGLSLTYLCLFVNGVGVTLVLSPSAAYIADVMDSNNGKGVAAIDGIRPFFTHIAVTVVMPMIDNAGMVWTNTGSALLAWVGFGLLLCTLEYGEEMRAWEANEYVAVPVALRENE